MTELYSTSKGIAYQCDLTNRIELHFKEFQLRFTVAGFMVFRRNINQFDIPTLLFNLSDECDSLSLDYSSLPSSLTLTLCDMIQLRELVSGTQFSLELVAMLHEVLGDYEVI